MTTLKSFCKMRNLPKITKPVAVAALTTLAAVALAAALSCFSPRVFADTAPDWLRAAAHQTLPEYPKDTIAVVLLDEEQTTVKDNGDIETRHRRAYKPLRPEARDKYAYAFVQFNNDTKLSFFKAWTITANGQEMELKEKDAVEFSLSSFEVFSDLRGKGIKFSAADPGNIVGYEYVQKHRPFAFEDDWQFQSEIPTRRARFSLQLPVGWEFSESWANFPKQQPQSSANNFNVWEVENVPAVEIEPAMPPFLTVASRMDIKYFPRDPALRAKTTGTWNDIGILQPHPAADVFKHQYGDCKDKVTLLSTMLKQVGIDSYYVMVDTHRGI